MEKQQQEQLRVDLVQTTSVLNQLLNNNCTFDGSNLIYLAGTSIVFHNVFQNLKHFRPRLNNNQVQAMMFYKTADVSIALVTKVQSSEPIRLIQFYISDKNPVSVELHEDITVHDGIFLQKNKVCLLCFDHQANKSMMLIVSSHRKLKRIPLEQDLIKFSLSDRKLLLRKNQKGCVEFNTQIQSLEKKSQYSQFQIKQILSLQEAEIVITKQSKIHVFVEHKQIQEFQLADHRKGQWGIGTRVGRNVLVAFKNELVIGNFQWTEGRLRWVGCFEYADRLRANIISMQNSADQMNMALAVQIFYKDSWTIEHFMFNLASLSSQKKFVNAFNRLTPYGSQTGDYLCLQRAMTSEVFMLSGSSIVNYSYVDHIEKKHKYVIHESPRIIALHPLGYQIMCTFQGAIKFYQKVEMELVEIWTESLNCTAAKYTESGLLFLSVFQQGSHQVILYNPNSFTRIRTYSNLYIKHSITAIELDETESDMILWSGKDLSVYKIRTAQKLSEFRQKRQGLDINCIQYDSNHKQVILGLNKKIVVCRKSEDYHLNFSNQKQISVEQNITCIIIRQNAGLSFMGTSDGKILFTEYPFDIWKETINDQTVYKINLKSVRVHSSPTSDLLLTNNGKFLFASSKGQGLAILRLRKNGGMGNFYNSFDISNYNFIETTSKPYLQSVQERLKILLEKRKAIFNELDEFKKQWQAKRQRETKDRNFQQKKQELSTINIALEDISKAKVQFEKLSNQLKELQELQINTATQFETNNHDEMLIRYAENDKLKDQLEKIQSQCGNQYLQIEEDCRKNLQQIQQQMKQKFTQFEDNFKMMKHNLLNFALRAQIQERQEEILGQKEIEDTRARLRKEQNDLYRKNHELKADITRNKKELQRFMNRRDFLENKQRFFKEEIQYCQSEEFELKQIKEELEQQLSQLENETQKKQKRLRKYFLQNEVLLKYQQVHNNLTKTTQREIQFIDDQHSSLRKQINKLQKQILLISENRSHLVKEIKQKEKESSNAKQQIKQLKHRSQYLELQIKQLERLLSTVGPGRQNQLQGLYERFFVGKRLEGVVECPQFEQKQKTESKQIEAKIRTQLHDHKNYLVKNMNLFEKCNAKIFDEIQTSYMKYQSENYALISECNVRKEQILKKKRVFQQMVNSMRETETCIQQIQNGTFKPPQSRKNEQQPRAIPFIEYEKQFLRKQQSEPTLHKQKNTAVQVRKMLDVQKCTLPESRVKPTRRIQTAVVKKQVQQSNHEQVAQEQCGGWFITKPQTANRKGRGAQQQARRLFSRNKSRSKPTTCTSHSKYSVFI